MSDILMSFVWYVNPSPFKHLALHKVNTFIQRHFIVQITACNIPFKSLLYYSGWMFKYYSWNFNKCTRFYVWKLVGELLLQFSCDRPDSKVPRFVFAAYSYHMSHIYSWLVYSKLITGNPKTKLRMIPRFDHKFTQASDFQGVLHQI